MLDLDGDGKADTMYIDGTTGFGVETATGAVITASSMVNPEVPVSVSAMVADHRAPTAVLANRTPLQERDSGPHRTGGNLA